MIGRVLNGFYQLTELVGSGGYADVYRARDLRRGLTVAVKVLHPHIARIPGVVARFEREVALARRLQTPSVARILDTGRDPATPPYMVMELIDGQTVARLVEQRGPLPVPLAVEIVDGLLGALKQAHALGIVHRDLKPHNLMLDTTGRVRVLDFGVARAAGVGTITADGQLLGTPEYMAPEQLDGRPIDSRADLYAAGAVLYHLLAGRPPYLRSSDNDLWEIVRRVRREPPPPLQQLRPELPPALVESVDRAMAREPAQRFQSAFEMQQALAVAAGADPPTPPPFRSPLADAQEPVSSQPPASVPPPASTLRREIDHDRPTVILPALPGAGIVGVPMQQSAAGQPPAHQPPATLRPEPQPALHAFGEQPTRIVRRPADLPQPPPPHPSPSQPRSSQQAAQQQPPLPGPGSSSDSTVSYGQPSGAPTPGRRGGPPVWALGLGGVLAFALIGAVLAVGWSASLPLRRAFATPTAVTTAAVQIGATRTPTLATPAPATTVQAPTPPTATAPVATAPPVAVAPGPAAPPVAVTPGPAAPPVAVTPGPAAPPVAVTPGPASSPAVAVAPPQPGATPAPPATPPPAPLPPPQQQPQPQPQPQPPAAASSPPPSAPGAPPGSEVIVADTFDRSEGGLLTRISPRPNDYTFSYERGEYAIKKLNPALPAAPIVFVRGEHADTVVAVDVRLVGEAVARYAFLVCRDRSSGGQTRQYRASIVPEGRRVILSHWQDGAQRVLAETRDNPAVQFGNATNRLELRCVGSQIEAIVNGKSVVSAQEGSLASGEHGLGAGTFSGVEGTLEARFDNLEIRTP